MSKLIVLAIVLVICSVAYSQFEQFEKNPNLRRVAAAICGPSLPANKKKIVDDCRKIIPTQVQKGYQQCVKEVFKVSKFTKPGPCYRLGPDGEKMIPCLQRKAQAVAKKLPKGTDLAAIRKQVANEYEKCMLKVL